MHNNIKSFTNNNNNSEAISTSISGNNNNIKNEDTNDNNNNNNDTYVNKTQNGMKKRGQSSSNLIKITQSAQNVNKVIYKKNILIHKRNTPSSGTFTSPGFKRSYTTTSITPFQDSINNNYNINNCNINVSNFNCYDNNKQTNECEAPPSPMKSQYGFKKHYTFDSLSLPPCSMFQNDNIWTLDKYMTYNTNTNNTNNTYTNKTAILNLEEILLLEFQLNEISKCVNNCLPCPNECFDYWNFFFNSSLSNYNTKFTKYFPEQSSKDIIQRSIHLELLSVILCYDLSFFDVNFNQLISHLRTLIQIHHNNLILISRYFLSKIISPKQDNIWINKLESLIQMHMHIIQSIKVDIIHQINLNCNAISDLHRIIIKNYTNPNLTEELIFLSKKISQITLDKLNHFYRDKVIRVTNCNRSILASSTNQIQKDLLSKNRMLIKIPYLNQESIKSYTLVLDLDETLVHFREDPTNPSKSVLHLRPGLFKFLEKVSTFYELVVFTAATKEYADPILEAIEQNKIIFEYKLYREHTVIIGEDFVKDISRLGRDLSKVIIIDNMPQCFRLQKENGIFIRPFYGRDVNDYALIELIPMLIKIAENGWDVRDGLRHFKDEIISKVTGGFDRKEKEFNY